MRIVVDTNVIASAIFFGEVPSIGKEGQVVEPLKLSLFGKKVAFYQLFPLYPEELEFNLEHGYDDLVELFKEYNTIAI